MLKTSSLIEINDTIFVFILPDNFIQPKYPSQRGDDGTDSEITTPNDHNDIGVDHELESSIRSLFEDYTHLDTKEIMAELKKIYNKPIEKESLLHLLVVSPKFHLAPNSTAMSSKESDQAKWTITSSTSSPVKEASAKDSVAIVENDNNNVTKESNSTVTNENNKSTELPPALLPSVSLSRLFNDDIDDGDWSVFMPDSPLDQPENLNKSSKELKQPGSLEQCSSFEAPSLEEPSSLEWDDATINPQHPLSPENGCADEQEEQTSSPIIAPPTLFRGLSIESMYSVWTSSTSSLLVFDESVGESSPNKRLKQTNSDGSSSSINKTNKSDANPKETNITKTDIYKEIHTKIII